jgi:histidinol-phosphatase (PHP family)
MCNHANGTIDEYIEKAISENIDIFGFSEHAPMDFDQNYRISFDHMSRYESMVKEAKKKYADKIEILLGYEVDFIPNLVDQRVLDADVDYLIGSVHFLDRWGFDNPEFIGRYESEDIDEIWQKYFDQISFMAQSRLFDIVGHLDLIKVFKFLPNKSVVDMAIGALREIKKADMVIEINGAGYRKPIAEAYPSQELLEAAFELDIPITFASDAHEIHQVGLYTKEVISLAKKIGYKKCAVFRNRNRELINF